MITPELIEYIKGEFAKGKKREEIHKELVANGGWSEVDLNEAFRTVIPMQGIAQGSLATQSSFSEKSSPSSLSLWKIILAIVILGAICFAIWFYRAPLLSLWNSGVDKITELANSFFVPKTSTNTDNTAVVPENNVVVQNTAKEIASVKDCGISTTPDLKNYKTYQNDAVLSCLGNSALNCEDAQAVLKDPLFPTIFQIVKTQDTCNFRLSYGQDSTLVDVTGRKLAGQYIMCPLGIVKAVDETKNTPSFNTPSTDNLGKYASQIYFYGTLGVFMENNIDQSKIQSVGCSGNYISSVIASYHKMQGN